MKNYADHLSVKSLINFWWQFWFLIHRPNWPFACLATTLEVPEQPICKWRYFNQTTFSKQITCHPKWIVLIRLNILYYSTFIVAMNLLTSRAVSGQLNHSFFFNLTICTRKHPNSDEGTNGRNCKKSEQKVISSLTSKANSHPCLDISLLVQGLIKNKRVKYKWVVEEPAEG